MMRIGFIFPSSDYLFDPFRSDPHTHFQILSVLERRFQERVRLDLIDLRGIKKEFAIYHIPECDLYLHSTYTLDYPEQSSIVRALRARYPAARHIAGGPHATVFPDQSLEVFDALILGDGEQSVVAAVADLEKGCLRKIYRQGKPLDINRYGYPMRHYLPKAAIARKGMITLKNKPGYDEYWGTTVMFSRGCPYDCHFCAISESRELSPGIRYRSPEHVEEEISYLKRDYGMQGISLLDEIGIPPGRRRAIAHLEAIGRAGILWRAQCRVDGLTPEIAKLAAQSGCVAMGLGVESVWQLSLDLINKQINPQKARETIALLKANGIEARIYMILGLPGEPEDIVERSWEFIEEVRPDLVFLSIFTVRPGTEIYKHPERFGIKKLVGGWENMKHMFGRYGDEAPTPTFEYEEKTPWGRGFDSRRIVRNYMDLQGRLKEAGLCSLPTPKPAA